MKTVKIVVEKHAEDWVWNLLGAKRAVRGREKRAGRLWWLAGRPSASTSLLPAHEPRRGNHLFSTDSTPKPMPEFKAFEDA